MMRRGQAFVNHRSILAAAVMLGLGAASAAWLVGSVAIAPAPAIIGAPPADLGVEPVSFPSASGSLIKGWFMTGAPKSGAVVLLHGIRANRLAMVDRARMLKANGFAVLMIDFQAHGESTGSAMTFGYLESMDARAAVDFVRQKVPGGPVGVIGVSLGGAAAVLADPPLQADAMVLEAVYGSIREALENRLAKRAGRLGPWFAPVLLWQLRPRLGVDPAQLSPSKQVARVQAPLLLIAGEADTHATLAEMKLIYEHAPEPKGLWIITGAQHIDFMTYAPDEYEQNVVRFLGQRLRQR